MHEKCKIKQLYSKQQRKDWEKGSLPRVIFISVHIYTVQMNCLQQLFYLLNISGFIYRFDNHWSEIRTKLELEVELAPIKKMCPCSHD